VDLPFLTCFISTFRKKVQPVQKRKGGGPRDSNSGENPRAGGWGGGSWGSILIERGKGREKRKPNV